MKAGLVDAENLNMFRSLLLPSAAAALDKGGPVVALGLVEDQVACGAAVVALEGDTLDILSLYVAPDYRRRGGCRLLVQDLCRLALPLASSLQISFVVTREEHFLLERVLRLLDFTRIEDGSLYALTLDQAAQCPFFTGSHSRLTGLIPFRKLPKITLKMAYQQAVVQGENYLPCQLTDPSVDPDASLAIVEAGEIKAFVVFTVHPGRVELAWLQSGQPEKMAALLRGAFQVLRIKYPGSTLVHMLAVHPLAEKLIQAVLPRACVISRSYQLPLSQADWALSDRRDIHGT